jgi:hypothetical protein
MSYKRSIGRKSLDVTSGVTNPDNIRTRGYRIERMGVWVETTKYGLQFDGFNIRGEPWPVPPTPRIASPLSQCDAIPVHSQHCRQISFQSNQQEHCTERRVNQAQFRDREQRLTSAEVETNSASLAPSFFIQAQPLAYLAMKAQPWEFALYHCILIR